MKIKLRETLIGLATDVKLYQKFKMELLIPLIVVSLFLIFFNLPIVLAKIWLFIVIVAIVFLKSLEAINRNKLILDKNKLIYIILSSKDVWFYSLMFGVLYPLLFSIATIFGIVIFFITYFIMLFVVTFFSIFISKHFYDKLEKMEMWH